MTKLMKVRESLEPGPFNPKQPIPRIKSLNPTGVLRIGWDRKMLEPEDYSEINPSKVGIRDSDAEKFDRTPDPPVKHSTPNDLSTESITPDDRRRYLERDYAWFEIERNRLEWMMVVDALELKMRPGDLSDPQLLRLTWNMLDFNKDDIWIQLYFEYPPRISEHIEFDSLEVYFWGTEYFKSW